MKILICEDNPLALKALSVVLERHGFEPVTASDGNEAKALLESVSCDLIIVDLHLPYLSGLELIKYLRSDLRKKTPVLVVTAFSDAQVQRQAAELGISGYIVKPFNPTDLLESINAILKH